MCPMVGSLYLAEADMWIRCSLLEQPGLGLPLISVDNQKRTVPANATAISFELRVTFEERSKLTHVSSSTAEAEPT